MKTNTVQSQTHHHMPKPANSGPVTDFQDSVDGGAGNDRYTRLLLHFFYIRCDTIFRKTSGPLVISTATRQTPPGQQTAQDQLQQAAGAGQSAQLDDDSKHMKYG